MNKLRKIKFNNHPILENLELDFCDSSGKSLDTIIIAGENGTGKSTILESLYKIASSKIDFEFDLEVEINNKIKTIKYYKDREHPTTIWIKDNDRFSTIVGNTDYRKKYDFNGIYSDVEICFNSRDIKSVTSMNLEFEPRNRSTEVSLCSY